jgi:hypothetical protein
MRNYHYYNAFALLHGRLSNDIAAAQLQTYLNPVLDLPFYGLMTLFADAPRTVAFFMGLPFGLMAFFLWRIARRLFDGDTEGGGTQGLGGWAAPLALAFGVTGTASFGQLGLSTGEIPTACLVLAGLDRLIVAVDRGQAGFSKTVLGAGFLAGLAVGCKLTAVPYAVALAAATVAGFGWTRAVWPFLALGVGGLAGTLTGGGLWMAHLALSYGNPVFPYQNTLFQSPWALIATYFDGRFFPRSTVQWLFYPFWWLRRNAGLVAEYPSADARFAAVFVIMGLAALMFGLRRDRVLARPAWRALVVFWVVGYVTWLRTFSIYRYAVPLEMVGGLVFVGGIRMLIPARPALALLGAGLAGIGIGATTIYPDWGHIPFQTHAAPVARLDVPSDALVIAAGDYPMGYFAAFLPVSVPVVGAYSNFVRPPERTRTLEAVERAINSWTGPILVLRTRAPDPVSRALMSDHYHLAVSAPCQTVQSAWDENALELCNAQRLDAPG